MDLHFNTYLCVLHVCGLIFIGLSIICIIILSFLFGIKSRNALNNKDSKISNDATLKATFTVMILAFTYAFIDWVHILIAFNQQYILTNEVFDIVTAINDFIYYLKNFSIYLVLILRVYHTFDTTMYQLTSNTKRFLVIVLTFDLLAVIAFSVQTYFFWKDNTPPVLVTSTLLFVGLTDWFLNGILAYLFLSKLRQVICDNDTFIHVHEKSSLNSSSGYTSSDNYSQERLFVSDDLSSDGTSQNHSPMVDLMTRFTLLTLISILFGQGFNCTIIYGNSKVAMGTLDVMEMERVITIAYILRSIEGMIDCLVLYLMYAFSREQYQFLCNICHGCLYRACINHVRNTIDEKVKVLNMTIM